MAAYSVNQVPSRLELAESHCDVYLINFDEDGPVDQIIDEHEVNKNEKGVRRVREVSGAAGVFTMGNSSIEPSIPSRFILQLIVDPAGVTPRHSTRCCPLE